MNGRTDSRGNFEIKIIQRRHCRPRSKCAWTRAAAHTYISMYKGMIFNKFESTAIYQPLLTYTSGIYIYIYLYISIFLCVYMYVCRAQVFAKVCKVSSRQVIPCAYHFCWLLLLLFLCSLKSLVHLALARSVNVLEGATLQIKNCVYSLCTCLLIFKYLYAYIIWCV